MAYSKQAYEGATAHLAKWEELRPLSDQETARWIQEQHRTFTITHLGGMSRHHEVMEWMCTECARLKTAPSLDDPKPNASPEDAIVAWKWNQMETARLAEETKKLKAKAQRAEARKSNEMPKAFRRLSLFGGNRAVKRCAPVLPVWWGADDPITMSSAEGSLNFERPSHHEARCEFCKALAQVGEAPSDVEPCLWSG